MCPAVRRHTEFLERKEVISIKTETINPARKKPWTTPELTVHGTVEELTQQLKLKVPGTIDDFGVSGISSGFR